MIRYGIFDDPPRRVGADLAESGRQAQDIAAQSIVLLKNDNGILPLDASLRSIAVIGAAARDPRIHGGPTEAPPSTISRNTLLTSACVSRTRASSEEKSGASPARAITR